MFEAATTCTQCDAPAPAGKPLCAQCDEASRAGGFEEIPGGRYEIVCRLGTGAFGSVYQALDTFLNRLVAVKSIRMDTTLDPEHRKALNKRFIREAQVAGALHHPNIVTIHDIIFTPETGFIVMEFIEGRTLQSLLRAGRLPRTTAVDIAAQIGSALHYAHERKIIHRDIKPANIMITPRYEARITDFGIAKSDGASHLTMSGSLVGTPDYMSPEQAKGEDVDPRSDIFSLGCVLYECAVGDKPFKGGSLTGVLLSIVNTDPLSSPAYRALTPAPDFERVLKRALAKDPGERYSSAAELVEALRSLVLEDGDEEPPAVAANSDDSDPTTVVVPIEDALAAEERQETLRKLQEEERPLVFAPTLSDELQEMSLTPAQGFILSRIDGASLARDIIALSPLEETEVAETLSGLIEKGLLAWGRASTGPAAATGDSETKRRGAKPRTQKPKLKPAVLQQSLKREMERILELGEKERYTELLGVEDGVATAEVKKSYLEVIERFHPDAHPGNLEAEVKQKLSKVCAIATEALTALSAKPEAPKPRPAPPTPRGKAPVGFDRKKYAEDLFHLAEKAYETTDYWDAIQLARQAIELDDERAEYHHLLGRSLMKNRNWFKEAEESLRRATELDPTKPEYFGLLAAVYKAEGEPERSASMMEKAKALDPSYLF